MKNAKRHEGLRDLLRRPLVGALLAVSAGMQVVAVVAKAGDEPDAVQGVVAHLDPLVVEAPRRSEPAAAPAAETAQPDELAALNRARGFRVTDGLAKSIHEAATANGIDPEIAFGLVRAESGFRSNATSRVGATGLTQLMPGTARWLEPGTTRSELRNPDTNLRIGFRYLRQLIDRYQGDVNLALTAYNRGPGTVDRVLKRGGNPDNGYAAFVRTGNRGKHKG